MAKRAASRLGSVDRIIVRPRCDWMSRASWRRRPHSFSRGSRLPRTRVRRPACCGFHRAYRRAEGDAGRSRRTRSSPRKREAGRAEHDIGREPIAAGSAQRDVAIAVAVSASAEAVDAVAPLPGQRQATRPRSAFPTVERAAPRQLSRLPPSANAWVPPDPGASPLTATTPPIASDPHKADCGPRTTSIRETMSALSNSNRGVLPAAGSLARMPSMNSKV